MMRFCSFRRPQADGLQRGLWLAQALLLAWVPALTAQAQEGPLCGTPHDAGSAAARQARIEPIPLTGEVRALLVFVRFADDDRPGDGCSDGGQLWPLDADRPTFADLVLSPTAQGAAPDSSLTTLFRLASSGRFELYGSAFGHVSQHPGSHYFPGNDPNLDRASLTREILVALRDQGVPLADYDANGDGVLDQLIVVVRSFGPGQGLYNCQVQNGVARCADGIATLFDGAATIPASEFGIAVHPVTSGQYSVYQSVRPYADLVSLVAHETGHHLWTYHRLTEVHLEPVVGNRVPSNDDQAGSLALMIGGGPVMARTAFPTAAERDILSEALSPSDRWLTCAAPVAGRTYELGDTFSTGDCLRLDYGPACSRCSDSRMLVSGVYRDTPFAQAATPFTTVSSQCVGCVQVEAGLPATGVMLEVVQSPVPGTERRDLIPSDNHLATFTGCGLLTNVAPTAADVFGADLWMAGARAIHPFSSPNIYGYASMAETPRSVYDTGGPPHELSGFRAGASGRVVFDYRTDLLERDSLVADGDWSFGPQFGPLAFDAFRMGVPGHFALAEGTRLTVGRLDLRQARSLVLGDDVELTATEMLLPSADAPLGLQVGARSRLTIPQDVVSSAQPVRVGAGALLHVQGDLFVRGALEVDEGAQLVVDGDLTLNHLAAETTVQGSVRVGGRLLTSGSGDRQIRVDHELEVGGVWEIDGAHVLLSVGNGRRLAPTLQLRGGVRAIGAGRLSLTLTPSSHAEIGGVLPVRAGSSLVLNSTRLVSGGGVHVDRGGSMVLLGSTIEFGPDARLDLEGRFQSDFGGVAGVPSQLTAHDPDAGWAGMTLRSESTLAGLIRAIDLTGVVDQPAILSEASNLSLAAVHISSPRAAGAVVIRGGWAQLSRVEVGPAVGVGLDVSGGAQVTLMPPVTLVGHRVALRVDSSSVRSSCTASTTCSSELTSILPDRSLPDAAEVELWNGATVHLPYAEWWVTAPSLLRVGGDGTGVLEVEPMGRARPAPPPPPDLPPVGRVAPNPARSGMTVRLALSDGARLRLHVHDMLGRRLATQTIQANGGVHDVPLPLHAVPAGTYLLTVEIEYGGQNVVRHIQSFTVVR